MHVIALEISPQRLDCAQRNARVYASDLGVGEGSAIDCITWVRGDALELLEGLGRRENPNNCLSGVERITSLKRLALLRRGGAHFKAPSSEQRVQCKEGKKEVHGEVDEPQLLLQESSPPPPINTTTTSSSINQAPEGTPITVPQLLWALGNTLIDGVFLAPPWGGDGYKILGSAPKGAYSISRDLKITGHSATCGNSPQGKLVDTLWDGARLFTSAFGVGVGARVIQCFLPKHCALGELRELIKMMANRRFPKGADASGEKSAPPLRKGGRVLSCANGWRPSAGRGGACWNGAPPVWVDLRTNKNPAPCPVPSYSETMVRDQGGMGTGGDLPYDLRMLGMDGKALGLLATIGS